ncbi:hypothetical protein [Rhizobium sp. BK176]|uniref:hypothetical protein n=1 Tax=Rhizobium sp. BK176 TaxID=2587071 RepID=UPI002166F8DA|nr:hypothetical protein [Rhizobium sp. BK176]MCS4088563.1 ElaB/YqjD/DUF883 family membrane-anchored ribosome-binding protein [Rhizobium sp. BK176]
MSVAFVHPLKGEQKKIATKVAAAQSTYASSPTVDSAIVYLDDVWTVTGTRRDTAVKKAINDIAPLIKEVESALAQSGEDPTPDFALLRKVLSALWTAQKGEDAYTRAIAERTSESAAMTELQRANIAAKVIGRDLHARAEALKEATK